MCFPKSPPPPAPAPPPPAPPPELKAPTAATPSAATLPDSQAYTTASSSKKKGKSIRNNLRIELGSGSALKSVGTGINTNQ